MATSLYQDEDLDWQKQLEGDLASFADPEEEQVAAAPEEPLTAAAAPAQAAGNPAAAAGVPQTMPVLSGGVRTMASPPPPPPPATPPPPPGVNVSGLPQMLEQYATEWMGTPNRYLSPLVTQTREAGDQRRTLAREAALRNIDEVMSSRGTVGVSTPNVEAQTELERRMAADVAQEELQLQELLAQYESMDRLAAGEFGLDVYGEQGRQGTADRELDLRQQEISQEGELFMADLAQRDEHFGRTLQSEDARFAVDTGLREKALALESRGMDLNEAYRQAALEQERELQLGAQALTRAGMELDNAYRYAALSQDSEFRDRALVLQEEGMELDEAFRQAELEFRERSTERATNVDLLGALSQHGGLTDEARDLLAQYLGEEPGESGGGGGVYLTSQEGTENAEPILEMSDQNFRNVLRYAWDEIPFGDFTNSEFQRFMDRLNDADMPDMLKRVYIEEATEQRRRSTY